MTYFAKGSIGDTSGEQSPKLMLMITQAQVLGRGRTYKAMNEDKE
jgi:hypothetical protein